MTRHLRRALALALALALAATGCSADADQATADGPSPGSSSSPTDAPASEATPDADPTPDAGAARRQLRRTVSALTAGDVQYGLYAVSSDGGVKNEGSFSVAEQSQEATLTYLEGDDTIVIETRALPGTSWSRVVESPDLPPGELPTCWRVGPGGPSPAADVLTGGATSGKSADTLDLRGTVRLAPLLAALGEPVRAASGLAPDDPSRVAARFIYSGTSFEGVGVAVTDLAAALEDAGSADLAESLGLDGEVMMSYDRGDADVLEPPGTCQ